MRRNSVAVHSTICICTDRYVVVHHGGINEMERPRGVNMIYSCGGDPLCTVHQAEGLYG